MESLVNNRKTGVESQVSRSTRVPGRSEGTRGRILFVSDVRELLRGGKSDWWVRNHFAPEHRFYVGRTPAWWESDALAWLDGERSK